MTDVENEPGEARQAAGDAIPEQDGPAADDALPEEATNLAAEDAIAERAADLATEVTEAGKEADRRRMTASLAAAVRSGARATGRGRPEHHRVRECMSAPRAEAESVENKAAFEELGQILPVQPNADRVASDAQFHYRPSSRCVRSRPPA